MGSIVLEAFLAIFALAVITTIAAFFLMDSDLNQDSSTFNKTRPVFLLAIALFCWFTSVGLLTAPSYSTVFYPAHNVITLNGSISCASNLNVLTCDIANTIAQYPAYSVTTEEQDPFSTYAFYEYLAFAGAMDIICIILLVIYILRYGLSEFKETFTSLTKQFRGKRR